MKKLAAVLLLAVIAGAAYSQSGVIREFAGDVELKHAGSSSFVAARSGATVAQDTIISTGLRSTAVIAVGNSTITVRPLTRLSLAEISRMAETENLNINLQTGRIRVDVKPPAGTRANTKVQTPSATASVRGTSFEMDALSIRTTEGSVSYAGRNGQAVMVGAGSASEISADGESAVDPVLLAQEDFASISRKKTASFKGNFGVSIIVE